MGPVRKALLVFPLALIVAVGWIRLVHRPSEVEDAVLSAAEAGAFRIAGGYTYNGEVECRVDEVEGFHGQDLYLCKLGFRGLDVPGGQYIYAAMVDGELHTRQTDPAEIPTRTLAWEPRASFSSASRPGSSTRYTWTWCTSFLGAASHCSIIWGPGPSTWRGRGSLTALGSRISPSASSSEATEPGTRPSA